MTGSSFVHGIGRTGSTVKYSSGGEELWVARKRWYQPIGVALDGDGNIIVVSSSFGAVKYSSDGEELWVARYEVETEGWECIADAASLDRDGNVYVTGRCGEEWDLLTHYDQSVTVKYSAGGEELWIGRREQTWGGFAVWYSRNHIALDGQGNVYVAGNDDGDYATEKYSQGTPQGILPSDCSADGTVDISDGISLLGHLFLGAPSELPCGDGTLDHPANLVLLDANGDEAVDLSDSIYVLTFLFLGGPPPALGMDCVAIEGCPAVCTE